MLHWTTAIRNYPVYADPMYSYSCVQLRAMRCTGASRVTAANDAMPRLARLSQDLSSAIQNEIISACQQQVRLAPSHQMPLELLGPILGLAACGRSFLVPKTYYRNSPPLQAYAAFGLILYGLPQSCELFSLQGAPRSSWNSLWSVLPDIPSPSAMFLS